MLFKRYSIFIIILSWVCSINVILAEQKPTFDHLTIENGLLHNAVNDILIDSFGYVWIATNNGLNRYDGHELLALQEGSPTSPDFKGRRITALLEDHSGNIWVGTGNSGVNVKYFDEDVFVNLSSNSVFASLNKSEIYSIYEDSHHRIWFCTLNAGLFSYDPSKDQLQHYTSENSRLSSNAVSGITEDDLGQLWIVTSSQILQSIQLDNTIVDFDNAELSNRFVGYRKQIKSQNDTLWIATEGGGLFQIDLATKAYKNYTIENGLSSNVIRDLELVDSIVYAASDGGGLNVLNLKNGLLSTIWKNTNHIEALNSNALLCLTSQENKSLWIGTYNGGVNYSNKESIRFEHFGIGIDGFNSSSESILAILELEPNNLLMSTDGGGLIFRGESQEIASDYKPILNRDGEVVKTLYKDSGGNLWLGAFGQGLRRYDKTTKQTTTVNSSLDNSPIYNIWTIDEANNGDLILGTYGAGLWKYIREKQELLPFPLSDYGIEAISGNISKVLIDSQENIWIGTDNTGVVCLRSDNSHSKFQTESDQGLSDNEIRTIFEDDDGAIWVGSDGGGVSKWLNSQKAFTITKDDGLVSNNVMGITQDQESNIWVSTISGVSILSPEGLLLNSFNFRGKQVNQFNQDAILTTSESKIVIGGIKGLHSLYVSDLSDRVANSRVQISGIKVLDEVLQKGVNIDGIEPIEYPIHALETLTLPFKLNSISVDFTSFDFSQASPNPYLYRLLPIQEEWRELASTKNSVVFNNLQSGTFELQIKRGDGLDSLEIKVSPPFYQTWWFRLLIGLILIALLFAYINFSERRQKELHDQKLEKARSEILSLNNEKLEAELDAQNTKLLLSSTQMAQKNSMLIEVKSMLSSNLDKTDPNIRATIRKIESELRANDYWSEFNNYFEKIDKRFTNALVQKFPQLTKNDLRICGLIKLNMSTKEIASILNISLRGVEKAKYRLKKRLELEQEQSLDTFIIGFRSEKNQSSNLG